MLLSCYYHVAITRRICTDLFGSAAVTDDKTEAGIRMDVIGYTIDLTIARKNFLKALYGFVSKEMPVAEPFPGSSLS